MKATKIFASVEHEIMYLELFLLPVFFAVCIVYRSATSWGLGIPGFGQAPLQEQLAWIKDDEVGWQKDCGFFFDFFLAFFGVSNFSGRNDSLIHYVVSSLLAIFLSLKK